MQDKFKEPQLWFTILVFIGCTIATLVAFMTHAEDFELNITNQIAELKSETKENFTALGNKLDRYEERLRALELRQVALEKDVEALKEDN